MKKSAKTNSSFSGSRRRFLQTAGALAAGTAALSVPVGVARADDDDNEGGARGFTFDAPVQNATGDRVMLNGDGKFSEGDVEGGGSFTQFTPTGTPPFPIVRFGTWKAKRLLSFTPTPTPTYGAHAAGILQMQVDLIPDRGPRITGATMTVICNIGAGGPAMNTGQEEGVTLNLPDGTTFVSFTGLTVFSTRVERD